MKKVFRFIWGFQAWGWWGVGLLMIGAGIYDWDLKAVIGGMVFAGMGALILWALHRKPKPWSSWLSAQHYRIPMPFGTALTLTRVQGFVILAIGGLFVGVILLDLVQESRVLHVFDREDLGARLRRECTSIVHARDGVGSSELLIRHCIDERMKVTR